MPENHAINEMTVHYQRQTSLELNWNGVYAERSVQTPGEVAFTALDQHFVMCAQTVIATNSAPRQISRIADESLKFEGQSRAGYSCIVPENRGAFFSWNTVDDTITLGVDAALLDRVASETGRLRDGQIELRASAVFYQNELQTLAQAFDRQRRSQTPDGLHIETLAQALCVYLLRSHGVYTPRLSSHAALSRATVARVRAYARQRLHCGVSLDELAAIAFLSPFHFARCFKAATGLPPHRYVNELRLERARDLVCNSQLPMAQIARECGFCHNSHLSREFKRHWKIAPSELRGWRH